MIEYTPVRRGMVAIQLSTDEGAFICNIKESDIPKIDAGETGTFVVIHCAIRLDAMCEGRYELHATKVIETSSIDFCQTLQKKARYVVRKWQPTLCAMKGREDG